MTPTDSIDDLKRLMEVSRTEHLVARRLGTVASESPEAMAAAMEFLGSLGAVEHGGTRIHEEARSRAQVVARLAASGDSDEVVYALSRSMADGVGMCPYQVLEESTPGFVQIRNYQERFGTTRRDVGLIAGFALKALGHRPDLGALVEATGLSARVDTPFSLFLSMALLKAEAQGSRGEPGRSVREAVPAIVDALADHAERVEHPSLIWMGKRPDPPEWDARHESALLGELVLGDPGEVLFALREHWRPGDFDRLVGSRADHNKKAARYAFLNRLLAVEVLAAVGGPEATMHLTTLAEDPVKSVAKQARKALKKIT